MGKPNPGTDAALAAGCTCPVIDNHYGRGYRGRAGEFVFSGGCPVHADEQEFERDDDQLRYETETGINDLSDDREALRSAGFEEEA